MYNSQVALNMVSHLRDVWDHESMAEFESLYVIYLDRNNNAIATKLLNTGSFTECSVDVRRLIKYALLNNSDRVIIAHNHPNGNPNPSQADIELAKHLLDAFSIFNINLVDNFILTHDGHYSFYDKKRLNVNNQTVN